MIVSPQEYNGLLHQLRDPNEFSHFLKMPEDEHVYNVDLNSRKIETPDFLSVQSDSNAEIIWFKTDRFYDNIDLYSGCCWIIYTNASGNSYFYNAPMQVVAGPYGHDYLLIPWVISKEVTDASGAIKFSFQFFKLSEDYQRFLYILNTTPTASKILVSLDANIEETAAEELKHNVNSDSLLGRLTTLEAAYTTLKEKYELYWLEA